MADTTERNEEKRLNHPPLNHTVRIVWRYIFLIMTAFAVMYFFRQVPDVTNSFLLAGFLSWLSFQPISWIQKKGVSHLWAVVFVYGGVFILLLLAGGLVIPQLTRELSQAVSQSDEYLQEALHLLDTWQDREVPEVVRQTLEENMDRIKEAFFALFQNFLSGFRELLSRVFSWMLAPVLSFYLLKDWEIWKTAFLQFFTPAVRREICLLGIEINQTLKNFITGQLLVSVLVGALSGCAALLLGLPFAWLIALLGMAGNWIPWLGALFSGIPAVVLAFMQSPTDALWMILMLVIVQQIESNIITPKVMGKKLDLNQLTILFVVLSGGQLFGIWGMMLAVPAAASCKVIVKRVYLMLV